MELLLLLTNLLPLHIQEPVQVSLKTEPVPTVPSLVPIQTNRVLSLIPMLGVVVHGGVVLVLVDQQEHNLEPLLV